MLRVCRLRCCASLSVPTAATVTPSSPELGVGLQKQTLPLCDPAVLEKAMSVLKYPYEVVQTRADLVRAVSSAQKGQRVALDIEACLTHDATTKSLGPISLIQLCSFSDEVVFLVDVLSLGRDDVAAELKPLIEATSVEKLFFDCRRDVEALSVQLGLLPGRHSALDLQLLFAGSQWKLRSVCRRSGMTYALKAVANLTRQESDVAVQLAMTKGNRAVWDVRPLPDHFLEYAAGDVRHTLLLGAVMHDAYKHFIDGAVRLTQQYVEHYGGSGRPVTEEADPAPAEVATEWLERFFGPGGVCSFCLQKGHTESECFRKASGQTKCTFCGEAGHVSRNCYKRHPQLLKCESCGLLGHSADKCYRKNPCKHCGGTHASESCHRKRAQDVYKSQREGQQK